jgi:tetratricopeptide (TPR) repeat protein
MTKTLLKICVLAALAFGLYRFRGWLALSILLTCLVGWASWAWTRGHRRPRNGDQPAMSADEFLRTIEEQINRADGLASSGAYDEAQTIYEKAAQILLEVRDAQRQEVPGQTVSLHHRIMLASRYLAVPLSRLADLHLRLGNGAAASRYFRQVAEVMQEGALHAGGETKTEFEAQVANAQRKAIEIEESLVPSATQTINLATFEAKYLRLIGQIMRLPGVASEATLLLARRVLQRRTANITDDDIRDAILDIGELPDYESVSKAELEGFAEKQGANARSLARDLADLYRDHTRLV